jgi:hypothetical protein
MAQFGVITAMQLSSSVAHFCFNKESTWNELFAGDEQEFARAAGYFKSRE